MKRPYKCSYKEDLRISARAQKACVQLYDPFRHASFISPNGNAVRFCGLQWPCFGLHNPTTRQFRGVDRATIARAQMMGWKIVYDTKQKDPTFSISRWPDGIHYFATVEAEDVQDRKGNVKWNTYAEAFRAVTWFKANKHKDQPK